MPPDRGQNVIGEFPGVDPKLKSEVVMVGGHVIVAMEALRILTQLHVRPCRTIRIALWSGEEQGKLGSLAYVRQHFASFGLYRARAGGRA